MLLVQEAGGSVLAFEKGEKRWAPFERFVVEHAGTSPTPAELRTWHRSIVVGKTPAVELITSGLGFPSFRVRRLRQRISRLLRRG